MIKLENVSKVYHNNGVSTIGLHNINLSLNKGEIVAITGESGSGKSTLLNVISKIDSFDEGEIYYKGNATSYFDIQDMDDFRKNKVGFIFQNYNILDSYTVLENVMLPLILKGYSNEDAKKEALKLLDKVNLRSRAQSRGSKLSGGEKQRCVIARALASDCEILACDEPTGNLDSETAKQIIDLIISVAENKLVLIVTHNFDEVKDYCTRELIVSDGTIVEDIKFKEVNSIDENENLDLDYKTLPSKVTSHIAKNNIFFTPHKSILMFLLMLIISFTFLYGLQSLKVALNNDFLDYTFTNPFDNYLLVYDNLHNNIDETKLTNYSYDKNPFSSQDSIFSKIDEQETSSIYVKEVPYGTLVAGTHPTNNNEFVIYVSVIDTVTIENLKDSIGKTINFYNQETRLFESTNYKLVGVGTVTTSDINYSYITECDSLRTYMDNFVVSIKGNYTLNNETKSIKISKNSTSSNTPKILIPSSMESNIANITYNIFLEDIYILDGLDIEASNTVNEVTLLVSLNQPITTKNYFSYVYASSVEIENVKKILLNNNLSVVYPPTDGDTDNVFAIIIEVLSLISTFNYTLYLIGIFFISYFILSKIYASRVKDFQIIRVLGVTKNDMIKVVNKEILWVSEAAIVLSFIIFIYAINFIPDLSALKNIDIATIITYFILLTIFAIFTARRFNVKLYKFSVRKSFNGGKK